MKRFLLFCLSIFFTNVLLFSQGLVSRSLYFSPQKADLTLESTLRLNKLADTLRSFPSYRITIAAVTPSKDATNKDYLLAQERLRMVEQYMRMLMIKPYDLRKFYDTYGAMTIYPTESEATGICRKNRVDIWIEYPTAKPASRPSAAPVKEPAPSSGEASGSSASIAPESHQMAMNVVAPSQESPKDSLPSLDSRGEEVRGPKGQPANKTKTSEK